MMITIEIPSNISVNNESLTQYLNKNIDVVKKGIHLDMSHLLTGAISETPKITQVEFLSNHEITIHYEFKWFIHNLCLNIIDDNVEKGKISAEFNNQKLLFQEALSSNSRSTADEL